MASLLKKCEWCKHIKYGPGSVLTNDFFLLIDILSDSVSQREKERERERFLALIKLSSLNHWHRNQNLKIYICIP